MLTAAREPRLRCAPVTYLTAPHVFSHRLQEACFTLPLGGTMPDSGLRPAHMPDRVANVIGHEQGATAIDRYANGAPTRVPIRGEKVR